MNSSGHMQISLKIRQLPPSTEIYKDQDLI